MTIVQALVFTFVFLTSVLHAKVTSFTTLATGKDSSIVFDHYIKQAAHPVVIRYSASWCGTCKRTSDQFEKASQIFSTIPIIFIEIDYDMYTNLATAQGIRSLPTYVYYKNGIKIASHGSTTYAVLINTIKKHFNLT